MSFYTKLKYRDMAHSPIARFESAVAVVADKMYVIGGHMEPDLVATDAVFAFCPMDNEWTQKRNAPKAVSHLTAAVLDDRYIWLAGGYEGQHPGTGIQCTMCYDAIEDRWEDGPPLPSIRASGGLALIGRHLHYFDGLDADRTTNRDDHWVLDVDKPDQWRAQAPMPLARSHAATCVVDGKIYAIGGHFGHDIPGQPGKIAPEADSDYVHMFDPADDCWHEVAPLTRRRSHCEPGSFARDGKIICIGGRNNAATARCRCEQNLMVHLLRRLRRKLDVKMGLRPKIAALDDVISYDPVRDKWSDIGRLPMTLYAPAAAIIKDQVIVTNSGQKGWQHPSHRTLILDM
ncbi:MAG: hypothetical protein ABJL99_14885 [Aliishimia sp.]